MKIDWAGRTIIVEARVVLRDGPLELFACSPQTREHESILSVTARPLHIFQAMGLIGLEAGAPARYDEKLDRWSPASGEPLDLRIQWRDGEKDRTAAPAAWMVEKKTGKPPESLRWVFAGSLMRDEGGFGADEDGTVVCVVDFDSALIALSTRHSADDAELWLSANPRETPPVGTRCTLSIRSAYHPKVEVEIAADGTLREGDVSLSVARIGDRMTTPGDERTPFLSVWHGQAVEESVLMRMVKELKEELRRRKLDPDVSMAVRKRGVGPRDQNRPGKDSKEIE